MQATTASPEFSNVGAPPTVAQPPSRTVPQRIGFNKNYVTTITGILRIALILFQFCAWVSAAAVSKGETLPGEIAATRSAYLFFSIVGWLLAIILFLVSAFNVISLGFFNTLPWALITMATDVLWILPTFVLAIVAAVRETDVKTNYSSVANVGAFGSASFFGFLNTIIYVVDGGYHLMNISRSGIHAPPSYLP